MDEYGLLPESRVRFRPLLAFGVAAFVAIGIGVGAFVWSLLPPGRYPALVAIVPAAPFLAAAWWLASRAGWDRVRLPDWVRWVAKPVAFILFILLFLWLAGEL